jgi:N4-gp56 family major capsid protein
MATTSVTSGLVAQLWSKELWKDVQDEMFWTTHGLVGEGPNAVIQKLTNLKKQPGDTINFGLTTKLSGSGKSGDDTLEGYEEAISSYAETVTVNQIRNAVRIAGNFEEQQACYDMRKDAKEKLKIWLAEYIQDQFFTTLGTSPTTNRLVYCSADHTADVAAFDTDDKLSTAYISKAKRKAMLASPLIRPINIKGKPHYLLVVHPYAARDLRADSTWLAAQEYAGIRGEDNPLFSGALGVWDGVIVHEHPSVRRFISASTNYVCSNLLLGAQAGAWAVAQEPFWKEDKFDYDNQVGFATGMIQGFVKTQFNSEDYGVITLYSEAVAD